MDYAVDLVRGLVNAILFFLFLSFFFFFHARVRAFNVTSNRFRFRTSSQSRGTRGILNSSRTGVFKVCRWFSTRRASLPALI